MTLAAETLVPRNAATSAGPLTTGAHRRTVAVLLAVALSATLLAPATASAISRNAVLSRAQSWVDSPVTYSQKRYHLGYRTDCSGYVSMCWKTRISWATSSFHAVTHKIAKTSLKPGDALLKKGYHIRLFYGWLDPAHTEYVAYEAGTQVAVCRIHSFADDLAFGYVPTRYDHISDSAASTNLLHNGSFNSWVDSWGSSGQQPVWWQTGGQWGQSYRQWGQTLVTHRKDTYRSTHSSAALLNPSADSAAYTELSQSTSVTAGEGYRFTAWAKTAFDARGLELRLVYLDAAGEPLSETTATGDASVLGSTSFTRMSVASTTPSGSVSALVSIRLAGGSTTDASGTIVPGSSAMLDDISLTRQ